MIKKIILKFIAPIDLVTAILIIPCGYILFLYRRIGSSRLVLSTWVLRKIGVFPILDNYYEPLFCTDKLTKDLSSIRILPGINFNIANQIKLLGQLTYSSELIQLTLGSTPSDIFDFKLGNGSFESGDAEFLYQFIRHFKPSKVIEIGSGNSTKIAFKAMQRNSQESSISFKHICIEPYEMPWLEDMHGVTVIRSKVEELDIDWHGALESGDLLFIDSSHIIRPQGDVLFELLEILPNLKSGVFVHIHDIFTPRDYLSEWMIKDIKLWNEQYIVEALLSNTHRYEIIAALNMLKHDHYDDLVKVCPYLDRSREPGSLYLRIL